MEQFESQFPVNNEVRQAVLKNCNDLLESWPDIVAMWAGMVEQTKASGWTEYASRALVLSQIIQDVSFIAIAVPGAIPHEETDET